MVYDDSMNMISALPGTSESDSAVLHQSLDLRETGLFPSLLVDYLDQDPRLADFYSVFPTVGNAVRAIESRHSFGKEKRQVLVDVLNRQYAGEEKKPDFSLLLSERTFTVTTGHQLNIFTGPLYVIYKIVSTINLARVLKKAYPEYNFVPLYWMATEDHDFDEIASFHLFGKTHTWVREGSGAVGRLSPKGLKDVFSELPEGIPFFDKAYLENDTLADAVRCYMNGLFGEEGLVCLDPDAPELKRLFLPVLKEELFNRTSSGLVAGTTAKIASMGYHCPVNPREVNLFYLLEGVRERIVKEEAGFHVLNTDIRFTGDEISAELDAHPERFSPNVVLRPLYEEFVLPNLAYIGGPSEIPYWMQLKDMFDHYQVPFPMLIPRNFVLYINSSCKKRFEKLGLAYGDIFKSDVQLRKSFVEGVSDIKPDLSDERASLDTVFQEILSKAVQIDKSLEGLVNAEKAKLLNSIDNLEKRIRKADEKNYETQINQLLGLRAKLFPGGGAQERHDNFLNFYLNDPGFLWTTR